MFQGKPIIGITGGIGSGKSFVAKMFGELGCCVIDSDAAVRQAYADEQIMHTLRQWWGPEVFTPAGAVDRSKIARMVFSNPFQRQRLEGLLHPWVGARRDREMALAAQADSVVAFVWDTPLLFETGLSSACDSVVFVDATEEVRQQRVRQSRGWDDQELKRREILQWPLDKKRALSDHVISNAADAAQARTQVLELLPLILAQFARR